MKEITVIMLSKAKQSKAKQSNNCILINDLNFYIYQIFRAFSFLNLFFGFAKILSFAETNIRRWRGILWERGYSRSNTIYVGCFTRQSRTLVSFVVTVKNNFAILNLVKYFLTLIKFNFDSLHKENKNPYLVINKNSFLRRYYYAKFLL